MNCKFDDKILHLYVDNQLGDHTRSRLIEHLNFCDRCQSTVESIKALKTEVATACTCVNAPGFLAARISSELDAEQSSVSTRLNLPEKLKLLVLNLQSTRNLAVGFAFVLILFIILIPGKSGMSSVAGELAREYKDGPGYSETASLLSSDPGEITRFFNENIGLNTKIPQLLHEKYKLEGGSIIQLRGNSMAHIRYTDGISMCSMFIVNNPSFEPDRSELYMASGIEFEIFNSGKVNFICWSNGLNSYILCGNCCPLDLVNMAVSDI
ncbi:MAG: hypothetical protein GY839_13930 [candidate division Zixibacteria bacterium]|nr:hypothetical protein [candidate division Zixibacteria bacterium]